MNRQRWARINPLHTLPRTRGQFLFYLLAILCFALATLACGRSQPDSQNTTNLANSNNPQNVVDANAQDLAELRNFRAEELLKELRARELDAKIQLPVQVLERITEEGRYQPELKTPKRSARLSKYKTEILIEALRMQQKTVYGNDDRKDLYNITDPQIRKSADSVVSLFHERHVVPLPDGARSKIERTFYGTLYNLCYNEPFREQPCTAFCSGVLVAPDIVATAGHCVDTPSKGTPPVTNIKFVFGYRMRDSNNAELIINNEEIYSGKEIVARDFTTTGPDWALVRLHKPVVGHEPVPIRISAKISDTQSLYMIGHPCGLPAKFADGANVRDNSDPHFFVANLDSYTGNSGSPIFNSSTHEVEALLVRGELNFVTKPISPNYSCNVSLVCPNTGCRGEDGVRTTLFAHLIP